jgi:hypothetical protein
MPPPTKPPLDSLAKSNSVMGFSEARRAISLILFIVHEALCGTYLVNIIRKREHIHVLQVGRAPKTGVAGHQGSTRERPPFPAHPHINTLAAPHRGDLRCW